VGINSKRPVDGSGVRHAGRAKCEQKAMKDSPGHAVSLEKMDTWAFRCYREREEVSRNAGDLGL